jgi:hypothetical protein
MHAAIKIVSFMVFGAAVALGNAQNLLLGLLLVLPLYLLGGAHLGHAIKMLRRLRWLFLSILIIYLFFTPGQLVFAEVSWGPTYEGLAQGGQRIAALVLLVAAVNWLINSTSQEAFLAAVLWCLQPLARFGFPHERLAVRITLTLEAVGAVRSAYRHESREQPSFPGEQARLFAIVQTAHRLYQKVVTEAQTAPIREIVLPAQSRPPLGQWFIPVLLSVAFAAANLLVTSNFELLH